MLVLLSMLLFKRHTLKRHGPVGLGTARREGEGAARSCTSLMHRAPLHSSFKWTDPGVYPRPARLSFPPCANYFHIRQRSIAVLNWPRTPLTFMTLEPQPRPLSAPPTHPRCLQQVCCVRQQSGHPDATETVIQRHCASLSQCPTQRRAAEINGQTLGLLSLRWASPGFL